MSENEIIIDQGYGGLNPVQFGHEVCEPSHAYGPAVRTYYLIHYVHRGCGIFVQGGMTHRVQAGDMFVIRPLEETYYEADGKDPWEYSWIGFTAKTLPLDLPAVVELYQAGEIFDAMRRCREYEGGRSAYLSAKLWELFAALLEGRKKAPGHVEKALTLMRSEYMNGITILDIASRLNLDRSYFSTLFRESMGVAPQQYLNDLRMENAARLMAEYAQPPTIAALSTGYTDIYNFSRMFKKHYGVSPREYIRLHRVKN